MELDTTQHASEGETPAGLVQCKRGLICQNFSAKGDIEYPSVLSFVYTLALEVPPTYRDRSLSFLILTEIQN